MQDAPAQPKVNYEVAQRDFKYYIFDWDDNVLHMPTRIYMEHRDAETGNWLPAAVSTSTFAVVRKNPDYRMPLEGGRAAAFRDFQDGSATCADDTAFIRDTRAALARVKAGEAPGPSFETLRKTLREGRIFAIVTARGHAPETIRRAVEIFIEEALTDDERAEMMANLRGYRWHLDKRETFGTDAEELAYYLSICRYHAVTWSGFHELIESDADFAERYAAANSGRRPELAKEFAIRDITEHLFHVLERTGGLGRPVSVGFSDDDAGNVAAVSDFVRAELTRRFPGMKFVVYDTSDPTLANGRKVTVAGQLNLPGF